MNFDYAKRGLSLPAGCKDLTDVSKYLVPEGSKALIDLPERSIGAPVMKRDQPARVVIGEMAIDWEVSVAEVAALLGQHPSRIIVDLLRIGIYSTVETRVGFWVAGKVAREYGYEVKLKSQA